MSKFKCQKFAGFTLIELLVVIVIIGILASFSITSYTQYQKRGRDAQRKYDLKNLQSALEQYYSDQVPQNYPNVANYQAMINTLSTGTNYVKTVPHDPSAQTTDYWSASKDYYFTAIGCTGAGATLKCQDYTICAKLENTADPDITKSPCTGGTPPAGYNYGVRP